MYERQTMSSVNPGPAIDVRRADTRFVTDWGWLDSRHSFSFGHHYDPANTGFGLLLVSNDDIVKAGTGFETHGHRDMEIVTWVIEGSLVHQDSRGNSGVIYPGLAQRMSAGTGILHSEKNDAWTLTGQNDHEQDVHFIQMWVAPDTARITPGYEQLDINEDLGRGGLVPVASGRPGHDAAIRIAQRSAALLAARIPSSSSVALPAAPYVHLFVAQGVVELEGAGTLVAGDSVRITASDGRMVGAIDGDAEILVWEMHASV
jgi:redox-sensitive bicupin YhaK (pirin superfamily)